MKKILSRTMLFTGFGLLLVEVAVGRVGAQTFTNLHTFANDADGIAPSRVTLSGNILYGAAGNGTNGNGTVFAVNLDGTGITVLHSFAAGSYSNSDGELPQGRLILSNGTLYGAAYNGGTNGTGTIFAVSTNGTGFTVLHSFTADTGYHYPGGYVSTNSDGARLNGDLLLAGGTLYGTAEEGGTNGTGTLFAVNTDGTGFTVLHTFSANIGSNSKPTNSDGMFPGGGLILSGSTLYGTAGSGGTNGTGTIFAVNTNGTGFTVVYAFTGSTLSYAWLNSDGVFPNAGLILSGSRLYGTAMQGGTNTVGTVFGVNTDGTGLKVLHAFTNPLSPMDNNGDGYYPQSGLLLAGSTLYGATELGGSGGSGCVFAVGLNGAGFTNLHSFATLPAGFSGSNSDGGKPSVGVISSANILYGTTSVGGSNNAGTLFGILLPPVPQLAITLAGTNVILTWPTSFTGYTLQAATNLVAPVWTTIPGQNAVTNPITGAQMFYRLSQ